MKRILLDTHAFLWWVGGDRALGKEAIKLISDMANDIFVSAATPWEIAIKKQKGLLKAPSNLSDIIKEEGFKELAISAYHGEQAGKLSMHHKDPFDRMLIAQAQAENLLIMTADTEFAPYSIRLIDALK